MGKGKNKGTLCAMKSHALISICSHKRKNKRTLCTLKSHALTSIAATKETTKEPYVKGKVNQTKAV
jgi:hypothetical protein